MKTHSFVGAALALAPLPLAAQDHSQHEPQTGHSGMDHSQAGHAGMTHSANAEGSGTARLPEAEGMMAGLHFDIGSGWQGMAHGFVSAVATEQTGPRGDSKFYAQSMAMLTAERRFAGGRLQLRGMVSAEPLMDARGYPNLFATGETAGGEPLVDRQHPHDFVMELAARLDLDLAEGVTGFLYGGPVGEPALGPSAFMHRSSARLNPEAPITHHWFDSTHITYGVVTAGLAASQWQLEASAFRGAEPDEERWSIETPRLDSWSVRASFAPSDNWLLQASHGRMEESEALHPGEDEARTTASIQYHSGKSQSGSALSAMLAFSAKNRVPGDTLTAWLGEVNWDLSNRHTLFGRAENVANDELFHDHHDPLHDRTFRITKFQLGYAYSLPLGDVATLSLGGSAAAFAKPSVLDAAYGDDPLGLTAFARLSLGR